MYYICDTKTTYTTDTLLLSYKYIFQQKHFISNKKWGNLAPGFNVVLKQVSEPEPRQKKKIPYVANFMGTWRRLEISF